MKTSNILNLSKINFGSKEAAKDAIKFITDLTGIKSIECDKPTDYFTFINLDKSVLIKAGLSLYAIWIKSTYVNDKKVFQISLQIEESLSMKIGKFINEKIERGELLLTESMADQLANLNND